LNKEGKMMNRNQKIVTLLVVLLILTGIAAFLLAHYQTSQLPQGPGGFIGFQPRQYGGPNAADIELYYMARAVFSTINIVLTIIIIVSYADIYMKTRAPFTFVLLLFAMIFLIKDITWSPFFIGWFKFTMLGLGPFAMLPDMFETAALLVLFYLAVKY